MRVCVIIPAYNESKEIAGLIKDIKTKVADILVVDDGSGDSTGRIASEAGATVIRNSVNRGKGVCLSQGFKYALANNFDAVITMDGDGQHLPDDLTSFTRAAEKSASAVFVGNRMLATKNMPWLRVVTNRFMSWMISILCKQDVPDTQCGFRLIKKEVLEKVELKTSKFEAETEILLEASRSGFKIDSVPIKTVYRGEKSQINPFFDTIRFIRFIIKTARD